MVGNDYAHPELQPGTRIDRYRIERELGKGGESTVYLATDLHLGKQWAVKVLRCRGGSAGDPATGESSLKRLLSEEAELMKRLDHPALPRIVDILEKEGTMILVMDYVEGETLSSLLKRAGPFREEVVREWMYRLASVLLYLHGQDPPVIYRDMKPSNVIRKPDGSLVLLDFGIAREYKRDRGQDTSVLGTRGYAPPEQYGNAQTDIRSDIYSLGMTAAELLTGCPPDQDPYLYKSHPLRKLSPGISKEFETILNRCLAFSPRDRYASCRELMEDLKKKPALSGRRRFGERSRLSEKRHHLFARRRPCERRRLPGRKKQDLRVGTRLHGSGKQQRRAESEMPLRAGRNRRLVIVLAAAIVLEGTAVMLTGETDPPAVRAEPVQEPEQNALQEIRDLLQACGREDGLTETKSHTLQKLLAELSAEDSRDAEKLAEVCFEAGQAYLYTYTGDSGSFRSRVLRAQPLFEEALQYLEKEDGTSGKILSEERVRSYVQLCRFFALYVFDRDGIAEPEEDESGDILRAVQLCLDEAVFPETGDGAWLQLILLQSMEELLREYRQNLAYTGISQEDILRVLQIVEEKTEAVQAKRETLTELRTDILHSCAECREEIGRTYANIEKWKEAETGYGGKEKDTG